MGLSDFSGRSGHRQTSGTCSEAFMTTYEHSREAQQGEGHGGSWSLRGATTGMRFSYLGQVWTQAASGETDDPGDSIETIRYHCGIVCSTGLSDTLPCESFHFSQTVRSHSAAKSPTKAAGFADDEMTHAETVGREPSLGREVYPMCVSSCRESFECKNNRRLFGQGMTSAAALSR